MSQIDLISPDTSPPLTLLPPMTADRAIALARWWLRLGTVFNVLMMAAMLVTSIVGFQQGLGSLPVFIAAFIWLGVIVVSVRARRLVVDAVPLIAAGEFGEAEDRLSRSMRSFSVLRSTRLLGLQQLAHLRHSQSNWSDTAKLCEELIERQRPGEQGLELSSRLMLAESLIELGRLPGAAREIGILAGRTLGLRETLALTHLRIELQVASSQFAEAVDRLEITLGLVELMSPPASVRCHAMLALAAKRQGLEDWHRFLARRATLLADVSALIASRPFLREAFESASAES